MKKITYLLVALFMFGCASMSVRSGESWVRYHLENMTLKEKIGQIMVPAYAPIFYNEENYQFKRLLKLVRDYKVGGVMFWRGNPYSVARTIDRLQSAAAIPLLVMADMEWGLPQRVDESTRFLQNMATGATGNEKYAYEIGQITANEAKAIGVHIGFAPVMDVNNNPDNIIINTRSFGEDPALVSRMGTAFIRGLQAGGVYATAKHFPGHGDTGIDTHMFLPSITVPMDRIRSLELPPFKAAVDAGVKCVMVAHITFSQVKQMGGRPATLDPYFIEEILRKEMGFDGLVVTDAMDMGSITDNYWSGEAAVMAINAGADMVLLSPNFETTFEFVLNAAREGRIEMGRIDEAVGRILTAKADHGLERKPVFNIANLEKVMSQSKSAIKAEEISNAAMTLVRDDKNVIPFHAEKIGSVLALTVTDEDGTSRRGSTMNREIGIRVPNVKSVFIDPRSTQEELKEIMTAADSVDAVIVGIFMKWRDRKGTISLPDTTVSLLREFFKSDKPMAVIAFGSPYTLRQIPEVPSYITAYETVSMAQRSAIRAIFGEIPLRAKLPVSIPGLYKAGDGLERERRKMELVRNIDDDILTGAYGIIEQAISDSIFPGAQLVVVRKGELIEKKKILLDMPVKSYLPEFSGGKKDRLTLRHLFTHSSGIHWWIDLWNKSGNKESAYKYIYDLPLDFSPGDSMIYSDLGIMLIMDILETVSGQNLDRLANRTIFRPMGLKNTMFNPPAELLGRIAPTEIDTSLKRGLVHGKVHDENAAFLGGVSSHAGLFSTAEDLASIAQMLLNGGIYRHRRFFSPETVKYWTKRQHMPSSSDRAIGWDTPSDHGSSAGDYFSEGSFGHLGFTGTSFWVDPKREIAVILLSNRVHPSRERGGMYKVRRDFHQEVMRALLKDMGEEAPDLEERSGN